MASAVAIGPGATSLGRPPADVLELVEHRAPREEALRPSIPMWSARPPRGAMVRRPRLVRRLSNPEGGALVLLVAPPGYGKTALLREWAEVDERPFAWVALDERDNEPGRLLAAVAEAVDAAVGGDGRIPFVLVLDDVQALHRPEALDVLPAIANDLPECATLALASRTEPALPVARTRTQGLVTELGPRDLAMTAREAASLLKAAGHSLGREAVDSLVHRTEGWPAGLSLAAVFLADGATEDALARFHGEDRLVAQYVRDEILSDLSADRLRFVLSTSVLDVLTGPLCDVLLERSGSATTLAALAGEGLVVPLDRREERYRHHRLVAETLRAELRRVEPELERELHRRASCWHDQAGDVDRAVQHALLAGDVREAGELVWKSAAHAVDQRGAAAVERRLALFTEAQIAAHPSLALAAAGCELANGQGHLVEHWARAAAAAPEPSRGRAVDAGVILMRAAVRGDAPALMREAAGRAHALQPLESPWRPLTCLIGGVAHHLEGNRDDAARELEEGARLAAVATPSVQALCLAELAMLALERDDWEGGALLITRARAQVDRHRLGGYATSALAFAVSALVRAHRGLTDGAREDLEQGARLVAALTDFAPWYEVAVRTVLARAALRLSRANLAREQLDHASRLVRRVPEAVALQECLAAAHSQLETYTSCDGAPPTCITAAELRVLRYLPTHFSFREIGERTYVSANTVKSQANAVYRKLGVSCRSEAVARARACGLLDD